jgi:hypothetical protein
LFNHRHFGKLILFARQGSYNECHRRPTTTASAACTRLPDTRGAIADIQTVDALIQRITDSYDALPRQLKESRPMSSSIAAR